MKKKYKISKYLDKENKEKFSVAILQKPVWFLPRDYYYTDENLKGLTSMQEAENLIKKKEECVNFVEYR